MLRTFEVFQEYLHFSDKITLNNEELERLIETVKEKIITEDKEPNIPQSTRKNYISGFTTYSKWQKKPCQIFLNFSSKN